MKTDAELMNDYFDTNRYEPQIDWRAMSKLAKYSPDQPRDPDGKFGEGSGYAPKQEGEATKAYLKRVVDKMPRPDNLPEEHDKYFNIDNDTQKIPTSQLVSSKSDEENKQGGENAPKRMLAAYHGVVPKRDPISVTPRGDGKYLVTDGNGTFTTLKGYGWKQIPAKISMGKLSKLHEALAKEFDPALHPHGVHGQWATATGGDRANDAATEPKIYNQTQSFIQDNSKVNLTSRMSLEQIGNLASIYASAAAQKPVFDKSVMDAAKLVGAVETQIPDSLKPITSAVNKIEAEYKGDAMRIKDVVRATIVINDPADAGRVIDYFKNHYVPVDKIKNGFVVADTVDGYRDAKITVAIPHDHIGEVQINLPEMVAAKEVAHPIFKQRDLVARAAGDNASSDQKAQIKEYNRQMHAIYDPAWNSVINRLKASKSIANPLRKTGARGKARGGDVSKANTRNPPLGEFSVLTGTPSTSQYVNSGSPSSPLINTSITGVAKYSPNQARDKDGKFSSGGGDEAMDALFSQGLGIKRGDMPQIPNHVKDKFLLEQQAQGAKINYETVPAKSLKPTQSEYNKQNIDYLRSILPIGGLKGNPIVVSQDNRVLDGHHRWAIAAEANQSIDIVRVGLPIKALLVRASAFNLANGIQARTKHDADALSHKADVYDELEKMETFLPSLQKFAQMVSDAPPDFTKLRKLFRELHVSQKQG